MSIRDVLNKNPKAVAGGVGGLTLVALVFILWNVGIFGGDGPPGKWYFSDDDGKTWFADDFQKLAPFDHNGKTAYRAYVMTCDGGKTTWCAWLERYTPEGKQQWQEALAKAGGNVKRIDASLQDQMINKFLQAKRPGEPDSAWGTKEKRQLELSKGIEEKCQGRLDNLQALHP